MEETMYASAPSWWFRARWAITNLPRRVREAVALWMLDFIVRTSDSNLIGHARRELPTAGGDEMQAEMNRGLLQLLAVFSMQGHSGFSASYAASVLEKLMRFEPLGPLTGADDEWFDHGNGVFQNMRCGHVFKQADRFNGQAYDLDGRIFREPSGACYTSSDSMLPITFPYVPKREYVDVPA